MKFVFKIALAATSFILLSQPSAEATQQRGQQQQQVQGQQNQGQRGGQPGGPQGRRGGAPNPENERRVREAVQNRMREVLRLPDSTLTRLTTLTFRYRDSSLVLMDRERFIRRELEGERRGSAPNDGRIACLLDNFFVLQQSRLNVRIAEDREVATFLPGIKRLQYFGMQENLHEAIDNFRNNFERNREGGQGRGGPPGPRGGGVGADGRLGGPPPQGGARPGGPGRAGLVGLCPPRARG